MNTINPTRPIIARVGARVLALVVIERGHAVRHAVDFLHGLYGETVIVVNGREPREMSTVDVHIFRSNGDVASHPFDAPFTISRA